MPAKVATVDDADERAGDRELVSRRRLTRPPATPQPPAATEPALVDSRRHVEHHGLTPRRLRTRATPPAATALDVASVDRAAASPRRPSPPSSTATRPISRRPLPDGATVAIVTDDTDEGRHVLRHSTAHVMAQAVTQLFPGAKFSIGPAIENGFYYDFELPGGRTFSEDDLDRDRGRDARDHRRPTSRSCASEVSPDEALELFADQPYKREIIERVQRRGGADADELDAGEIGAATRSASTATPTRSSTCAAARTCRPPAGSATSSCRRSPVRTGAATRRARCCSASTARRGSRRQALDEHLHQLEEAEKRDHRKLATELDLLSFPRELGGGLAVWHPKGAIVRKLMEDYSRAPPRARRLRVRVHAAPLQRPGCSRRAATSPGTPTACTRRWRWTTARTT